MAESSDVIATSAGANSRPASRDKKTLRIGLALIITLVLVGGAWLIGGHEDFSTIGQGGANAKLLPRVGDVAPDFTAYRLNADLTTGELTTSEVHLSDYRGQPVWINFWASWCQPCRAELPEIKAAYQQLEGTGIVVLAVSLREPITDAYLYAMQNQLPFVVLSDPDETMVGNTYRVNNFPTHIFIDAEGVVRDVELSPLTTDRAVAAAQKAIYPPTS